MEGSSIKRLALVLSVQAEIDGMKAENVWLINRGESPTYYGNFFEEKAEELRKLAARHRDEF